MAQTIQGQYKGQNIYAGTDAYVASQMQAIDSAGKTQTAVPAAQAPVTPTPQVTTPPAPTATQAKPPTTPASQPAPTTPTTPTSQTQAAPTQQPAQQLAYDPSKNPSVVDLLNSVGQDSSFAARKQLAQQFGIQNYSGSANQNIELAKKYTDFYNAKKGGTVPDSNAAFRQEMQTYDATNEKKMTTDEAEKSYFEQYLSMNPALKQVYDTISQAATSTAQRTTLREEYDKMYKEEGIEDLKMEAMDIKRIMEGNEDDIRSEIEAAHGFATEGQIRALTDARNKSLIRQASDLNAQIQMKEDYIDRMVQLTGMDREQLDKDLDRKLGLTKTMFDLQTRIEDSARDNYRSLIKDIGYDGLVDSISSPAEFDLVARSLGLTPKTLLQLSTVKTSDQRAMQLDELSYKLSVDKFNEDKRQFGLQFALDQYKAQQEFAAKTVVSPYQTERTTRNIDSINSLYPKVAANTVGLGSYGSYIPGTAARNFDAEVQALKANIAFSELTAMREASKTGGALGAISDRELGLLQSSLGALDTGQSPENFRKSLNTIKENIYRWNAQALSIGNGYDYKGMKNEGYTDEEIYNYFNK